MLYLLYGDETKSTNALVSIHTSEYSTASIESFYRCDAIDNVVHSLVESAIILYIGILYMCMLFHDPSCGCLCMRRSLCDLNWDICRANFIGDLMVAMYDMYVYVYDDDNIRWCLMANDLFGPFSFSLHVSSINKPGLNLISIYVGNFVNREKLGRKCGNNEIWFGWTGNQVWVNGNMIALSKRVFGHSAGFTKYLLLIRVYCWSSVIHILSIDVLFICILSSSSCLESLPKQLIFIVVIRKFCLFIV